MTFLVRQGFEIPPLRVWGLWAEYWDPPSSCCYYHNRQTHESKWDMPPGMREALARVDAEVQEAEDESAEGGGATAAAVGDAPRAAGGEAKGEAKHRNKACASGQNKVSFKMKRYRVLMNLRADEFQVRTRWYIGSACMYSTPFGLRWLRNQQLLSLMFGKEKLLMFWHVAWSCVSVLFLHAAVLSPSTWRETIETKR